LSYGRNRSLLYTTHRKNNKPQFKRIKAATLNGCAPNLCGNTWPAQHRGTALAPAPHQRGTGAASARRGCENAGAYTRIAPPQCKQHGTRATAAAPPNNLSSKQC